MSAGGFLDDNNFRCVGSKPEDVARQISDTWKRSETFHALSGICKKIGKTACFASTSTLESEMDRCLNGRACKLSFKNSFLLVGVVVAARGKPDTSYRSRRVAKACDRLKRARYAPVAYHLRSHMLQCGSYGLWQRNPGPHSGTACVSASPCKRCTQ